MKLVFHTTSSGRCHIEGFLNRLSITDRAVILAVFSDIREHGLAALGCQFRQIDGKLWEIRISAPGGGYRFFYVLLASDLLYVLHAYRKQGQKAPVRELDVARKRLREVLS